MRRLVFFLVILTVIRKEKIIENSGIEFMEKVTEQYKGKMQVGNLTLLVFTRRLNSSLPAFLKALDPIPHRTAVSDSSLMDSFICIQANFNFFVGSKPGDEYLVRTKTETNKFRSLADVKDEIILSSI
jgi:hypothetical protein